MKRMFFLFSLLWFTFPSICFSFPTSHLPILEYCHEQRAVLDTFARYISGLASHIHTYHRAVDQGTHGFSKAQIICHSFLPDPAQITQWQNSPIPSKDMLSFHDARLAYAYELGKLGDLQQQLLPLVQNSHRFWQELETVETLIRGINYQIEVVVLRERALRDILAHTAERAFDAMIQEHPSGKLWISMKADVKVFHSLLEEIRTFSQEHSQDPQVTYQKLRSQLSSHLLSQQQIQALPASKREEYLGFYETSCFEILPKVEQILNANVYHHPQFFIHRYEEQLGELSFLFAQLQQHLRAFTPLPAPPAISSAP